MSISRKSKKSENAKERITHSVPPVVEPEFTAIQKDAEAENKQKAKEDKPLKFLIGVVKNESKR